MPEFDAYLMVDWSANSRPVTGGDSIWYCLVIRAGDNLFVVALENPATRRRTVAEINDILRGLARLEQMTLVGFDFPYGYPAGSAAALGLTDTPLCGSASGARWEPAYKSSRSCTTRCIFNIVSTTTSAL